MSREACPRPKDERAGCPWKDRKGGCYSDNHHLYWPASDYKTPLEKKFRWLPENQEQTCRWEHDEAHHELPPEKPSIQEMRSALARVALERVEEGGNEAA